MLVLIQIGLLRIIRHFAFSIAIASWQNCFSFLNVGLNDHFKYYFLEQFLHQFSIF